MQSKNITLRQISKYMADLRRNRILSFHLLHPELDETKIHPSRSVNLSRSTSGGTLKKGEGFIVSKGCQDYVLFPPQRIWGKETPSSTPSGRSSI